MSFTFSFTASNSQVQVDSDDRHCRGLYDEVKTNKSGKLADYIPQLAKQNRDHFGLSVCTVDGQRMQAGKVYI